MQRTKPSASLQATPTVIHTDGTCPATDGNLGLFLLSPVGAFFCISPVPLRFGEGKTQLAALG